MVIKWPVVPQGLPVCVILGAHITVPTTDTASAEASELFISLFAYFNILP